jgi:hypothetical protein
MVDTPHATRKTVILDPLINIPILNGIIEGLRPDAGKRESDKTRPFTTPDAKPTAFSSIVADWAELRIGSPQSSKRVATSHSMHAVHKDCSDGVPSPGSRRPATRGSKALEAQCSFIAMARPATRNGMPSRGMTVCTAVSQSSSNDAGFEFWQDQESTLPAHFRLKSTAKEQLRGRMTNISIHLPEHTPASFVASKSLHFMARYKEVASTKYRVGSKSLRLQKTIELLGDIAATQELSCAALGNICKDLASEIFSHEYEGHDSEGVAIPMTWQTLCSNQRRELEDAEFKLTFERSQNEALLNKNQALAADAIAENEKMITVQVKNDLIMLEQKARLDEVQKQKQKLQELSASHQELEAAFWSSDVTRRAYKSALVHEANIQMNTTQQQYLRKSEDAFQQLLTVHKETLAKAHEIQRDSYAKDDLVTKLLNDIKETTLIHTRQEGLLVVYQDRVNSSVAKTIYDAVEDDLFQKNTIVIKLEEENAKLCAIVSNLQKELVAKSQRGRKDGSKPFGTADLMQSLAEFKPNFKPHGKPALGAISKDQSMLQSERLVEGESGRDDVAIPNFFVDGLSRRPGRVGKLRLCTERAAE